MAFEFNKESEDKVKAILDRYSSHKEAALMPVLYICQEQEGWVSQEAMEAAANVCGVHPNRAREVSTFYTMYNKAPVGKHHVQVCTNLSCSIMGSTTIVEHITKKLGIKAGETTEDGLFTLTKVECLGSCGTAPMMQINEEFHEDLTPEKVNEILDGLK